MCLIRIKGDQIEIKQKPRWKTEWMCTAVSIRSWAANTKKTRFIIGFKFWHICFNRLSDRWMFYRLDGNWVSGQGHMLGFVVWFSCSYWKNLGPLPRRMMWVGSILRIDPDITPKFQQDVLLLCRTWWNNVKRHNRRTSERVPEFKEMLQHHVSLSLKLVEHVSSLFFLELYTSSQNKSFENLHFILLLSSFWHISIWNPIGRVLEDSFPSGYCQNFGFHVKFDEFAVVVPKSRPAGRLEAAETGEVAEPLGWTCVSGCGACCMLGTEVAEGGWTWMRVGVDTTRLTIIYKLYKQGIPID